MQRQSSLPAVKSGSRTEDNQRKRLQNNALKAGRLHRTGGGFVPRKPKTSKGKAMKSYNPQLVAAMSMARHRNVPQSEFMKVVMAREDL